GPDRRRARDPARVPGGLARAPEQHRERDGGPAVSLIFPSGLTPSNPLTGFRFAVSFSDQSSQGGGLLTAIGSLLSLGGVSLTVGGFSEISGLDASIEMFDYKEGGRNDYVHKFATRATFGNLNFKRGVALTPDLWQWYDKVRHGSFGA